MSRKLLDRARQRRAVEQGTSPPPPGGRLSVALVYPNLYRHAMGNLGFLSVYEQLNRRNDTRCERVFLPDPDDLKEHEKTGFPLFSLETATPLADFDLIAFSLSFENDYLNLPTMLRLGRIPLYAAERDASYPLLLAGGVCAFLNPEPLATVMDFFAVGEAEVILPDLLDTLQTDETKDREDLLTALSQLPGVYVPSRYAVSYAEDGTVAAQTPLPSIPKKVQRQWLHDLNMATCRSFVMGEETEFAEMNLVEVSRGCGRGCRFCAAGFIYRPYRERSVPFLTDQITEGLECRNKVGLVGAAVSDYSELEALHQTIFEKGGASSLASLRIDAVDETTVTSLHASGHRTVALAPEAGSQRLRNLINKGLDEATILEAVRCLAAGGILNLKLYFLIGLPTEQDEDIEALLKLTTAIREVWMVEGKKVGRLGSLTLSVNPFIPKPFTPLQWAGMAPEKLLKKRVQKIRGAIGRLANTSVIFESLRNAILQAFLSRGDRRIGAILPQLAAGESLSRACRAGSLDPDFYVQRERGAEERLPWEVIDVGVPRDYLRQEYELALTETLSPCCFSGCHRCGLC
ncbi:MAG: radical SAM protein [Desulfuromonas sp.]|nr:MAG: radical SAM protein [Desulfuromonas sp.]